MGLCVQLRRFGEGGVIMVCLAVIVYLFIGVESSYGVMCSAEEVWRGWGDYGVLFSYNLSVYRRGMFLWSHVFRGLEGGGMIMGCCSIIVY